MISSIVKCQFSVLLPEVWEEQKEREPTAIECAMMFGFDALEDDTHHEAEPQVGALGAGQQRGVDDHVIDCTRFLICCIRKRENIR